MNIPPTMPPLAEWVVVPSDTVERLWEGAKLRDGHGGHAFDDAIEQPGGRRFNVSAEDWRTAGRDPHAVNFRGDLGEAVYSLTTGLPMNETVQIGGIKGDDFPDGINVKHTPFISPKCCLIVEPDIPSDRKPSRGYALVALDVSDDRVIGCILGWASNRMVEEAELVDYGYGPKRSIHHTALYRPHSWLERGAQSNLIHHSLVAAARAVVEAWHNDEEDDIIVQAVGRLAEVLEAEAEV